MCPSIVIAVDELCTLEVLAIPCHFPVPLRQAWAFLIYVTIFTDSYTECETMKRIWKQIRDEL